MGQLVKIAVVNLATEYYHKGQHRLLEQLKKVEFPGDFIAWRSCEDLGCPTHHTVPFAFKPYALMDAKNRGYDAAIWMDASMYPFKDLRSILKVMNRKGYFFEKLDPAHSLGIWCKNYLLDKFSVSRDEAMNIPLVMGGFIGINFNNQQAMTFLNRWFDMANDGNSFMPPGDRRKIDAASLKDPRVKGCCRDQASASLLVHDMGLQASEFRTYLAYWGKPYEKVSSKPKDSVVCYVVGQGTLPKL